MVLAAGSKMMVATSRQVEVSGSKMPMSAVGKGGDDERRWQRES